MMLSAKNHLVMVTVELRRTVTVAVNLPTE